MTDEILLRLLPELERFTTSEARSHAIQRAKQSRPIVLLVLIYVLLIAIGILGWRYGLQRVIPHGFLRDVVVQSVVISLLVLCGQYLGLVFWRARMRRILREDLNDLGIRICLSCGYELRGQGEPRCPECGTAFAPKRHSAQSSRQGSDKG